MWEIMWSWWWVKPLPSEKHFIRKEYSNIKENNNNNLIKNWLRASLKKRRHDTSRCKSANTTNNQNHKRSKDLQVKFLYESKSGKSLRQSGNYGDYVNPYFQKNINIGCCTQKTGETNHYIKMTSTVVEDQIVPPNPPVEVDSDPEDDPGRMLNVWLGQLQKDMASPTTENNGENGFHKVAPPKNGGGGTVSSTAPIVKRRQQQQQHDQNNTEAIKTNLKNQYRCSLINLEETQDEELDAILGELSILESQFQEEIEDNSVAAHPVNGSSAQEPTTTATTNKQPSPVASVASSNSRSSPTSSSDTAAASNISSSSKKQSNIHATTTTTTNSVNGKRTESPDTDSAFCDNLSVLSSCSTSSRSNGIQSSSGISSATSTPEEQEAKLKAEKIKLAIEKIKEANIKKIFIKVFTSDGSAKSLLVDEKMSVSHVTRILAEKNHVKLDPRWTLVELIPDLYMERVYEDHENLVENCLMWTVDSKNTLWFIERPEKYDVFVRPERYLLGTSSSQQGDTMEDHARQELLEEYFSSTGVGAPEMEGHVWLKTDNKKSWKKFFFVLRTSGLYYAPKGKKSSKDLVCLATFDVNQVYYGAGWKKKYKAPTDFCFAIKHPKIQAKSPKYIRYLCVDTEMEMHQWVTGIRVAKNGKQLFTNYRSIEEDITHADIDILTSKRFSVNSPNTLQINGQTNTKISNSSPARTPNSSSENKSLDSALSSGIVSDASHSLISAESKDTFDIIEVTPVNTIERNSGQLRRSMSKTSSTSSSSGCLSDRCSSGGSQQPPNHPMGFESDFPMGGTIKKRPSAIANVKLPLTNTTRGIIRDSDEELSIGSGDNIRIGGGGTLLRSAVRQSLRKNSLVYESNERTAGIQSQHQHHQQQQVQQPQQVVQQQPKHQLHTVQVHHATADTDPYSEEVNCLMEDLPPPPRAESIDQHLNAAGHELPTPSFDVDDLPPPPPEMSLPPPPTQHQQQPQTMPNLPTYLPIGNKKQTANKPIKRISFDDDVQVIGVSELDKNIENSDNSYGKPCTTTATANSGIGGILTYIKPEPYQANPKKLYSMDSNCQAAPPREFLHDLQKVMTKKWQVAEKCKSDQNTSPHQVLGFRDNDQIHHLVGHGQDYSRDESVGAWVLHSQQYAQHKMMTSRLQNQDIVVGSTSNSNGGTTTSNGKNLQKEPLYAVCSKNGVNNAKIIQPSSNNNNNNNGLPTASAHGPSSAIYGQVGGHHQHHGPPSVHHNARTTNSSAALCSGSPKKVPLPVAPPVVLREPPVMPLPMPPQPAAEPTYVTVTKPHHHPPFANVQPPQHCHQYPPHHMANLKKRAPPPPRRSENTHLTSS